MRGGGGWSILEFLNAWGGGKISMPPVVGVWIFSGTTHCHISLILKAIYYFN